jgi:hypothetical protein
VKGIRRLLLKKNKELDHGVCRGDNYNAWKSWFGNLKWKRLLDRPTVDGLIIIKNIG